MNDSKVLEFERDGKQQLVDDLCVLKWRVLCRDDDSPEEYPMDEYKMRALGAVRMLVKAVGPLIETYHIEQLYGKLTATLRMQPVHGLDEIVESIRNGSAGNVEAALDVFAYIVESNMFAEDSLEMALLILNWYMLAHRYGYALMKDRDKELVDIAAKGNKEELKEFARRCLVPYKGV